MQFAIERKEHESQIGNIKTPVLEKQYSLAGKFYNRLGRSRGSGKTGTGQEQN